MIELTIPGKHSLLVESPVLFAAGTVGFDGSPYRKLLALDKFGGLVTPPLTLAPRQPSTGPRVVPVPSGFVLHTGLPNPGISRTIREYESRWQKSTLPIIVHLVGENVENVVQAARQIEQCPYIAGVELGVHDEIVMRELRNLITALRDHCDLPLLVQLPLYHALELSEVAQQSGTEGLVIAAPPRGTARDSKIGRLVGGRMYGPWLKAQALRMVGRVVQYASVPVTACGGIHTPDDARDFITAGAVAVQLDSIVWVNPHMAETIAANLGGTEHTRTTGALADEWLPGTASMPPDLPELPDEDRTRDSEDGGSRWLD